MKKLTVLALVLSFATSPMAMAQSSSSQLNDSIGSTQELRTLRIENLKANVEIARIRVRDVEKSIKKNPHDGAGSVRKASLITLGVSVAAVVVSAGAIASASGKGFNAAGLIGGLGAIAGTATALLSGLAAAGSEAVIHLSQPEYDRLTSDLEEAKANLNELQGRLNEIQRN